MGAPLRFSLHSDVSGQESSEFPLGYDAVEAAPNIRKVVFENVILRVLEGCMVPPGTTIPIQHHRWPGFFLDGDTVGGLPHFRSQRADGSVRNSPLGEEQRRPGSSNVKWMKTDPRHVIEVAPKTNNAGGLPEGPPSLRMEIKG